VAPEVASVFNRSGISYQLITGYLLEDYVWQQAAGYVEAAKIKKAMSGNRTGLLGTAFISINNRMGRLCMKPR
jgi:L-arabinose isomerase